MSRKFKFQRQHFQSNVDGFNDEACNRSESEYRILSVNGRSNIDWDSMPAYRGSHFVRDPRCLVVSGYHYHLWTEESWCKNVPFNWEGMVHHPYFKKYVEPDETKFPKLQTYQQYLNSLDKERGMVVEMLWRRTQFAHMKSWNYNNPNIMELKYEDIIGNEVEVFRQLFEHYGFSDQLVKAGLKHCDSLSLKNSKKSKTSHTRSGSSKQWLKEFSAEHRGVFNGLYPELPVQLAYEQDDSWVHASGSGS
ncbi:MAG: sulfotransferase domain-containing protein [Oceanicoccus sp.]